MQLVITLKIALSILLTACLVAPALAGPTTPPTAPAKPKTAKAKAAAAGTKATAAKPAVRRSPVHTEGEVSGFTSETSDQFHTRLNLTKTAAKHKWWIRTDYGLTKSRTFGKKKITETDVYGYNLDAAYRRNGKHSYSFVALVAGVKKRTPHANSYYDESSFSMLSAGYGRAILPGLELETSLAQIALDKDGSDNRITPLYSIRMKTPINPSVIMDADVHLVEPLTQNSLVDSRMNLTYKLTPALSMRFTYVANNILGTTLTKAEWDKSFRVSLVFSH